MYSYIWEFDVHPYHKKDFESSYGPNGEWVRLFQRHPGYVSSVLLRDKCDPFKFQTLDIWRSEKDFQSFRKQYKSEYESLDRKCEAFTVSEQPMGEFEVLG